MSYLIQNFSYRHRSNRGNLRIRSSFLARNFPLIYLLMSNSSAGYNLMAHTFLPNRLMLKIGNVAFNPFTKVLFWKTKNLKYTPIGINFPNSAHYMAISGLDKLLTKTENNLSFPLQRGRHFDYPYFTSSIVALTPISGKTYSYTLYKFLRMNLNLWFYWPRFYKISINHTVVESYWLQLKFLNKYFFKIYNI